MNTNFETLDYIVFALYAIVILSVGLWVSRSKKGETKSTEDYFLASKSLPWWAIGASLIAGKHLSRTIYRNVRLRLRRWSSNSNIRMDGCIDIDSCWEVFFANFYKEKIYTIPEFVEQRYSSQLKTILAVFWIALYIFVNLASVLYLGGLALQTILGVNMISAIIGLALFAVAYSLYGGLSAVAWTDIIQVVVLILGGLVTTYLALDTASGGQGFIKGLNSIYAAVPERFDMILEKSNPEYMNLPGVGVLIGGMWIANLYYWGLINTSFKEHLLQNP